MAARSRVYAGIDIIPSDPSDDAFNITPNDAVDLAIIPRALQIGAAGDLKVTTLRGTTLVFTNVQPGLLPLCVTRVWATGTTATGISGLT